MFSVRPSFALHSFGCSFLYRLFSFFIVWTGKSVLRLKFRNVFKLGEDRSSFGSLILKYQGRHPCTGNPKTLTPGPRTPTTDRVRGLPMDRSTDSRYGPPLRTTPQNIIKMINKYFSYGLSNRLLVTAKFRTLHCANGQTWIQARV